MSRAFVKEQDGDREPTYRLPDRDSAYYDEAAAWALLEGANAGYTRGAELATALFEQASLQFYFQTLELLLLDHTLLIVSVQLCQARCEQRGIDLATIGTLANSGDQ